MKKTSRLTKQGIGNLPNDKPVLYKIKTDSGKTNYAGTAKRGRVQERIAEHLAGEQDYVPGSKVEIEQMSSVENARKKEKAVIARSKPKYNKQGK